jgi:hypothetical protein
VLTFAWRQCGISQLQWKHELYDRRLAIYVEAGQTIGYLFQHGTITDEVLFGFLQRTRESDFLMNEEITKQLDLMYEKAVDLQTLQAEFKDLPVGEERTTKIREAAEIKKWYVAQSGVLKSLFSPFLKLG